jgi:hypothetical protein
MKKILTVFDLLGSEEKVEYKFKPFWITAVVIIIVGLIWILLNWY